MGAELEYVGGIADGEIEKEGVDTRLGFIYKVVHISPFDYVKPIVHCYRISNYINEFGRREAFFQPGIKLNEWSL